MTKRGIYTPPPFAFAPPGVRFASIEVEILEHMGQLVRIRFPLAANSALALAGASVRQVERFVPAGDVVEIGGTS